MSKKACADLPAFVQHLIPGMNGRGRHSPLFRWLYDRAEAFKRVLEDTRPSWDAVTDALAKECLTNGAGEPLTRQRVQKTWYAVVRAKGWHLKPPIPTPVSQTPLEAPLNGLAPPPVPAPAAEILFPSDTKEVARAKFLAKFKPVTIPSKT